MTPRFRLILGLCIGATAVGIGLAIAGATRQRRRVTRAAPRATDFDPGEAAYSAATGPGIAPIDPQPITQIAGEGIDLDAQIRPRPSLDEVVGPGLRR